MAIKKNPKNQPLEPVADLPEVTVEGTNDVETPVETAAAEVGVEPELLEALVVAEGPEATPPADVAVEPAFVIPTPNQTLVKQLKEIEAKPQYPANLLPGHMLAKYRELDTNSRISINRVLSYCDIMAPRKNVDRKVMQQQQVELWSALCGLINSPNSIERGLPFLLVLIQEPICAALGENYINREMENVPISQTNRAAMGLLISGLRALAPISTRRSLIPLTAIARKIGELKGKLDITREGLQRLDVFFNVD